MKNDWLNRSVIAMIHVDALPGAPAYGSSPSAIIAKAKQEAMIYRDAGVDAVMIENMHDTPYLNRNVGPEISSLMSVVLYEVKNVLKRPAGIQILAGANKDALAAALAAGADFIRAEGFVFSHIADEGTFQSDAGELLRYRKQIGAEHIQIFTDIKKKHSSHAVTADVDIVETAKAAEFFKSDGVIITGSATGCEPALEEIQAVRKNIGIPVLAGSGITSDNLESFFNICTSLIVGSYFKYNGHWNNSVDKTRVITFMKKVEQIRQKH